MKAEGAGKTGELLCDFATCLYQGPPPFLSLSGQLLPAQDSRIDLHKCLLTATNDKTTSPTSKQRQAASCARKAVKENHIKRAMATQALKRNSKQFDFRDNLCSIIFAGNGDDITPPEMEDWVEKYRDEAMRLPVGEPLIVDYDLERSSSCENSPQP